MSDSKVIILTMTPGMSVEAAAKSLATYLEGGKPANITEESAEEFMAKGRPADCNCGLIICVCPEARTHVEDCKHRKALACAVAIECDHGYDVCPQCDPCTCPK